MLKYSVTFQKEAISISSKPNEITVRAIIGGMLNSSNDAKLRIGQKFAEYLNLNPGPNGFDNGIDGSCYYNGKYIHFQSKLSKDKIGVALAREYLYVIMKYEFEVSIYLSGIGYTKKFIEEVALAQQNENMCKGKRIYLLTIRDIFNECDNYLNAVNELPQLSKIKSILKDG